MYRSLHLTGELSVVLLLYDSYVNDFTEDCSLEQRLAAGLEALVQKLFTGVFMELISFSGLITEWTVWMFKDYWTEKYP